MHSKATTIGMSPVLSVPAPHNQKLLPALLLPCGTSGESGSRAKGQFRPPAHSDSTTQQRGPRAPSAPC